MPTVRVPVYLPQWLYQSLRNVRNAARNGNGQALDLQGDRDVEFSFIAGHMPSGPGHALDFGCGPGYLSLIAARRGFEVTALDLMVQRFPWKDDAVCFLQGDLMSVPLEQGSFDLIVNCSTVEHVGLAGRYGVAGSQHDGDLRAMARLRGLLRPGGVMLMTIPCGQDAVFSPLHRVYGSERLPKLLNGFCAEREAYWEKDSENRWVACSRNDALAFAASADYANPSRSVYALGGFVLRRAG